MLNPIEDDWNTLTQLHFAAQDGDVDRVKQLIADGFDVNAFDDLGMTPLHYAAKEERLDVVRYLIENEADVNAHDETMIGNTPLAEIAGGCSLTMAKLLIDAGADPKIPGWMQLTALDRAKIRKRADGPRVYELLIKASRTE